MVEQAGGDCTAVVFTEAEPRGECATGLMAGERGGARRRVSTMAARCLDEAAGDEVVGVWQTSLKHVEESNTPFYNRFTIYDTVVIL